MSRSDHGRHVRQEQVEGRTDTHREIVRSGLRNWRLVWDGRYKLVTGVEAAPVLHDLLEDPLEDYNIAADHPEIVKELNRYLPRVTYGTTSA